MKVFVVSKHDADGRLIEIIGTFSDIRTARSACRWIGSYQVTSMEVDDPGGRECGQDTELIVKISAPKP